MYCTGGLEPKNTDRHDILTVDDTAYILTDKFKTQLRDLFIDWGTFLEVYDHNLNYANMFDQIIKLLNIKENKNLRDMLLPLVKKIYLLPAYAHITCMMKQFMLYEPVSIVIYSLFTLIRHHFEYIVERFIKLRDQYIKDHGLKDPLNNWETLINKWNNANNDYELDSSSPILLFLNSPKPIKIKIYYKITGLKKPINNLVQAIKKFKYAGFCMKVPHRRLEKLLEFPLKEFLVVIRHLNPQEPLPNYKKIEKEIIAILKNKPHKPVVKDIYKRESPPKHLIKLAQLKIKDMDVSPDITQARINLIKWYVSKILDLRKKLLPYGHKYEEYYIQSAKILNQILIILKKELTFNNN